MLTARFGTMGSQVGGDVASGQSSGMLVLALPPLRAHPATPEGATTLQHALRHQHNTEVGWMAEAAITCRFVCCECMECICCGMVSDTCKDSLLLYRAGNAPID